MKAEMRTLNGCNNALIIAEYGLRKNIELGDNIIEFTPEETGGFVYTCWMGMIRSVITVEE